MNILFKPIITEKASKISERLNQYTFLVDKRSNKIQIKKAVENMYDVKVDNVSTLNYGSERKKRYTKNGVQNGKSNSIKKAIVKLSEGDKIDFYDNL
ncbi:50S ribosomal protein L23 [Bacteroidetes bacterium SCGC AAA795-G10]|nr:50S ribosomal protein L23 [Bacteroidetes bacterium SCGC AAA795-G10]